MCIVTASVLLVGLSIQGFVSSDAQDLFSDPIKKEFSDWCRRHPLLCKHDRLFNDWCLKCSIPEKTRKRLFPHLKKFKKKTDQDAAAFEELKEWSPRDDPESEDGEVTCIDPEAEDAEAWECECLDVTIAACEPEPDPDACFTTAMCGATEVCASWKDQNCETAMMDVSAAGALEVRKQKKSLDGSAAGLDGSVKGKCNV